MNGIQIEKIEILAHKLKSLILTRIQFGKKCFFQAALNLQFGWNEKPTSKCGKLLQF
ncbi:hypothetical protein LEP1GSC016_3057 [Leptospira borgpetersenii serovar Hardjo-bovis str. Sponselee]|uniref:Uncharacterized protein n=1 Tax=Leptospira borgpetersenii serovar Hardjo-bovis str. Sponselee TaxID=1303729 RepID=M6BYR0_LEPBO|nr:hypothetical protein LEP1GSC016_3057 [Leptospira borgpetersenii serovar Hardjo-bovis str. Sponselee]